MGIRLWERDFGVMLGLARNGFMSVEQIQKKWFPSYWSCIKRLQKLKSDELIDVVYIERNGSGVYYLTKEGLGLVNGYYQSEYRQYAKSNKVLHNLSCSEFYINIPEEVEVVDYQIEFFMEDIISDVYMVYRKDKEIDCLVEIDNLSKVSRFIPKVKKYNQFLESGKWKKYFKAFPRCVVVTNSKSLEKEISEVSKIPFKVIRFEELKQGSLIDCLG